MSTAQAICPCGNPVRHVKPSEIKRGYGKYCSLGCSGKYADRGKKILPKTCPCGKEFNSHRSPSATKKQGGKKYCGKICFQKRVSSWSIEHDACIECGTNGKTGNNRHNGRGLCKRCHKKEYRKTPIGKAEQRKYFQRYSKTENFKKAQSNQRLKSKYGITLEGKIALKELQKGLCAICEVELGSNPSDWHLDHNHETGQIRGILCSPCNRGLGCYKDNPITIGKAQKYLRKFMDEAKMGVPVSAQGGFKPTV